jgi:MoaA/NifB/PqqE/SkfB family radical SAM enzyme
MIKYNEIQKVHLEISTRCNAACPLCPRNLHGVEIIEDYPLCDMSLPEVKQIFSVAFLQQLNQFLINGNLGDFVTARDGLAIVQYLRESAPDLEIIISTNASAKPNIWATLAQLKVIIQFDLDGLADTHSLYRQYTDWDLVINNARQFINAGGYAIWKMIKFDHNQHQIEDCRNLANEYGFAEFDVVDQGRDSGPVFNRNNEYTHTIGTTDMPLNFVDLNNRFKTFRDDTWSYNEYIPVPKAVECGAKRDGSIYVAANGEVYPCCFTGFYPKQMRKHGNAQLSTLVGENNALEYGLEHSIEWFNVFPTGWAQSTYESGSIAVCNLACGVK